MLTSLKAKLKKIKQRETNDQKEKKKSERKSNCDTSYTSTERVHTKKKILFKMYLSLVKLV